MKDLRFEWDQRKNVSNQRKHGISFEEAAQVFLDPNHLVVADRIVDGEQRWQTLGVVQRLSGTLLLLVVAHTVREELGEEIVRIISARRATRTERRVYEEEAG